MLIHHQANISRPMRHCTRLPHGRRCHQGLSLPRATQQSTAIHAQLHTPITSATFRPPVIDISNLIAGESPQTQQVEQVQHECLATGFLVITGHGITNNQLQQLFHAAKRLFDLPLDRKLELVVEQMQRGRGYEISPEHKQYMQQYVKAHHQQQCCQEPSAAAGILSERFCCGPPLTGSQLQDPYYTTELGQVFFTPDFWPTTLIPELQSTMQQCYQKCEVISDAVLRLFAVALAMPGDFFRDKTNKHHSNMQVANYPSQMHPPPPGQLRKKAHVDSGTLTILASQDWCPGSTWQAGDGGLQLLNNQAQWVEVEVPQGGLLLNLGSLMTRWTNGLWRSTLHRVTNPGPCKAHKSRRLSMAFFHKPNYDAMIEVLPTCYQPAGNEGLHEQPQQQGQPATERDVSSRSSPRDWRPSLLQYQLLPAGPHFPPVAVGDITRQGILHKYRHLPPEHASRAYHQELLSMRDLVL